MQLTVLGKSPSWQDAGGACSGYLIEHDGSKLLLDCGSGVFGRLREVCDYLDVPAVVISHLHADHMLDLVPFSYALLHGPRGGPSRLPRLHAPPGAADVFRKLTGSWGTDTLIEEAFDVREYDPAHALESDAFRVRFCEVPHYTRAFAVELSAAAGKRITFGADCAPNPAIVQFAADTDLLLLEATLTEPEDGDDRGHLTPRQAGEHGRRAHARRLVLTHFSDELDAEWVGAEGQAGFDAPVELAHPGAVYRV